MARPSKALAFGRHGQSRSRLSRQHQCVFLLPEDWPPPAHLPNPPPSSPSQHSSSAPAANLISLADDDSPDAPDIFSVDPVADQLVQDGATALAGSVPLLMVTCRVQANDDPATALVDSGAGINVIDREYAAQLGLRGTPRPAGGDEDGR